ncbi:hypothetical protein NQZ68_012504 [Dissostichus eleginoides]|nr:hypothetical protein NQZ68_012504 [Dissostichus eleginoides]
MIRGLDPINLVRFLESFEHKGNSCLAFERMDMNLHQLLNDRPGNPLSLEEIKPMHNRYVDCPEVSEECWCDHADIKPQNIMLLMENNQLGVKVIDFGSAVVSAEVKRGVIMQPAVYRSPEVIMGLPITEAVDRCPLPLSLGVVLATMYLGSPLFPQRCLYYQIKTIVRMLGNPDDKVLRDGTCTLLYFSPKQDFTKSAAQVQGSDWLPSTKTQREFNQCQTSGGPAEGPSLNLNPEENSTNEQRFVLLLRKMLHLNLWRRTTPSDALLDPFITGLDAVDSLVEESSEEDNGYDGDGSSPPSTADSTDAHIGSGGVSARNSQGKRIKKFFVRMFRALRGCCSPNVEQ